MKELVLTGGTVLTMDTARPRAEALIVRANRIAVVGCANAVLSEAGPAARVVDLHGRTVMPGFNDSHAHLQDAGRVATMPNLAGLCKADILDRVRDADRKLEAGSILIATDWDYSACPDPHVSDLDSVVPDRPVYLIQHSGHAAWVNSAALELLRITRATPDWDGGGPERDAAGEITGVLNEPGGWPALRRLWLRVIRDKPAIGRNLRQALADLRRLGITSVQDNTWFPWNLDAISAVHREGSLTTRIACWSFGLMAPIDLWMSLKRYERDWYARGPRKLQLDGAFSTHTAWLDEPYADKPGTAGSGTTSEAIARSVSRACRRRRQLACHSIGDASTHAYVSAVQATCGPRRAAELRHRVEHGQLVSRRDIECASALGVVFSGQPFAASDPEKDVRLLGEARAARAYPYRSLLDAGVHLAFGSDYPGESTQNPFEAIHTAVNRESDEAITVEEALACYTVGSAYAEFREDVKGRLAPGYLADLIILSDDPTRIDARKIRNIAVEATVVDGEVVYARDITGDFGSNVHAPVEISRC